MTRGSLVTIAAQGDFGKQRPALVIQSDQFGETASLTLLPLTSDLVDAPLLRVYLEPTPENGLERRSQVMVDKALTLKRLRVGSRIGQVEATKLLEVERCLAVFLGIALVLNRSCQPYFLQGHGFVAN